MMLDALTGLLRSQPLQYSVLAGEKHLHRTLPLPKRRPQASRLSVSLDILEYYRIFRYILILFCTFPMTESFHWSRLRQGSTECPKLDKAFPRFNRLHCRPSGDIKQCSKQWTSNNINEWLWVSLSDLNVDLTVPWDIPGHLNLVQLLVQSNPIPVQPPRETSLERTERTERTTGRHGPPGLCRLWWKTGLCCLLNPAVRCLSELFELSDHMQHEKHVKTHVKTINPKT